MNGCGPQRSGDTVAPYVVEGRAFRGRLDAPERNEHRRHLTDDLVGARELAGTWSTSGFTVWLYDHGKPPTLPPGTPLRLLEQLGPSTPA